jgi:hypothetical protein
MFVLAVDEITDLDFFNCFSLESEREHDRALNRIELDIWPQPPRKIQGCQVRKQVEYDMIIDQVVCVGLEAFEIKGREQKV